MDRTPLIIKKSIGYYLPVALVSTAILVYFFTGPYEKTRIIFKGDDLALIPALLLITFIGLFPLYSWYNIFKRRPILILDQSGITYYGRSVNWHDIKAFETITGFRDSERLILKFYNNSKDMVIELISLTINTSEVRKAIINFFPDSKIIDEGHTKRGSKLSDYWKYLN